MFEGILGIVEALLRPLNPNFGSDGFDFLLRHIKEGFRKVNFIFWEIVSFAESLEAFVNHRKMIACFCEFVKLFVSCWHSIRYFGNECGLVS